MALAQRMVTIVGVRVSDVRFPTSEGLHGSDAMHPDPDYSAVYVVLETDNMGLEGHGLTFTIGRGNDVVVSAVHALKVGNLWGAAVRSTSHLSQSDIAFLSLAPRSGLYHASYCL